MARGNRKAPVFLDDHDREHFLEILAEALNRFDVSCYAMCLMGNHYHLVLMTPRGNLSLAMKHINQVFTQDMNWRYGWTGHVFESRFTSLLVDTDHYLRNAVTYVAMNPVEAGLVGDPGDWKWSSYAATAGQSPLPAWLSIDWLDWVFPDVSRGASQRQYREHLTGPIAVDPALEGSDPAAGGPDFRRRIRAHIGATLYRAALPRSYRALHRPTLDELFSQVDDRTQRGRLIQRAHIVHGYKLAEIADALRLHPNTVSRILGDLRRDAARRLGMVRT